MNETKCNGCRVFTLCLGDVVSLFQSHALLRKCYYCEKFYFKATHFNFEETDMCAKFQEIAKNVFVHTAPKYSACFDTECQSYCDTYISESQIANEVKLDEEITEDDIAMWGGTRDD